MTKDKHIPNNIIPFPNLEERLLEKGIALMENGDPQQALSLLLQAQKLNEENPKTMSLLAAAYSQMGNFQRAKEVVEQLLRNGSSDYFSTMEMYISILFQLNEYEKICQIIQILLDENHIPFEKIDQYEKLYILCKRMEKNQPVIQQKPVPLNLFSGKFSETIERISNIKEEHLSFYMDEIESFLKGKDRNPFIKTVLLTQLTTYRTNHNFLVHKYGKEVIVNPAYYYTVGEVPFIISVKKEIEKQFSHQNPVFMDYCLTLADRFFFNVYPLEQQFSNPTLWSEAIASVVNHYLGGESQEPIQMENSELAHAIRFVLEVEDTFHLEI
ncbi:tetratricopeptide repeat protein [Fervidibacillus halotolerans]|uniref:Tetratricopeptide repeat protein n=1 Tax=Fervidibacillus halotolerans TaxID=2980027 RepID=A0A9E8LXQ9_9BACI|nr:tetratricopeptide repeat protein [Fervidibacillus halotolerans]WAA11607.1 tetratricopeptide repeat protein [Fervidibacillus halotolerans]